jgi:hypothetical protein
MSFPASAGLGERRHSDRDAESRQLGRGDAHQSPAWFNNSQDCFGAGIDYGGDVVQVTRCCSNSCQSRTYGMFIFMIGSGSLNYFRSSDKPVSLLSVLMCHRIHTSGKGMLPVERNIRFAFCYMKMTDSDIKQDGNAFYLQRRGPHHNVESSLCPLCSPVCADQKILFSGLLSLRFKGFTYATELNSEKFLNVQVGVFSCFLRDFAIDGIPFLHSATFVCDNQILFRIVCKGSDVFAVDHLT